ncbi:scavenger receptor class F member 1 [Nothobranchius furzeri]|uniref:Scavenger receptor class F member 1 n=3 Tax=Nothobranchius TaxID=28779 RepID=A0A1A8AAS3_NOTFU|nr:scavenger receptor class F member 1 isoform X2 [Nothobranchius furzeri]KAF7219016.1 scavenger receptor class F member 1 [Nothobranchius furzeri]
MKLLRALSALLCCWLYSAHSLDPGGRNVCNNPRNPPTLICCTGWRQQGRECTIPVCEGEQACLENEICLLPGVCRCPPGFYGAQCKTRCPSEFWAPDCRRVCPCFPHGRCHPVTGECTCSVNRWGPLCQNSCKCARHGHCHPVHGNCTCAEGWSSSTCSKLCQCSIGGSVDASCDQLTGRCQCHRGFWGIKCSAKCNCDQSPCNQRTGVCECVEGWWGTSCERKCICDLTHSSCDPVTGQCLCHPGYHGYLCNQACEAGRYGSGCTMSCGHCKDSQPCSASDGACAACEPGWNGTRCDRACPFGFYGDGCKEKCPRCRTDESCHPESGKCEKCEPGWSGPRCEQPCADGTYGDACRFLCSPCYRGNCHHLTGRCVCQPGFQGESCNSSCSALQFGLNCSSSCGCGEGISCHPVTGACPNSGRGAVLAGVLVPLFLLLFAVLCCCLCCGGGPSDGKDRAMAADGGLSVRMKYHVYSVLANIGAALPCISDWSSGLPRVTVSHHDPELTFNHSFIEPPSSGWVTEGSSFESDEEEGEALYCVPPREDILEVAGGEFQEMSSKCNMFLDPSGFSCEDIASPFNIPRTSSIAKSKRPSVSFAEGTRFSPKERRGSGQDPGAPLRCKAKSPWGVLMLSALQSQGGTVRTGEEDGAEGEEEDSADVQLTENQESRGEVEAQELQSTPSQGTVQAPGSSGRRRTMSNAAARKGASDGEAGLSHKATTVYVTVGKAGRAVTKTSPSSEGPVQAMLRRLGSLQRQRDLESDKPKSKAAEGITKPPRRKLGARAAVWEQGGLSGGEAGACKPFRRKYASHNPPETTGPDEASASAENTPKRPLSSILKSRAEVDTADSGSDQRAEGEAVQGAGVAESCYQTIGAAGDTVEVIINENAVVNRTDEPCYENIIVK